MLQHNYNPDNFSHKRQSKDNNIEAQMKGVFKAPKRKTSTMLMVSIETSVLSATNHSFIAICWLQGEIDLLEKRISEMLKYLSGCYSTDRDVYFQRSKTYLLWK